MLHMMTHYLTRVDAHMCDCVCVCVCETARDRRGRACMWEGGQILSAP
jgi:hypothetical protein